MVGAARGTGAGNLILVGPHPENRIVPGPHGSAVDVSEQALRLLLVGSVVLISLGAFENLAVTTIMPVVARELDGLRLYALAMGLPLACHIAATAAAGLWVDARSLRGPLLWGVALFSLGLLVAGLAQTMPAVALGRGVTGLGTGILTVSLYAAVGAIVPPGRRPRFFAAFSAAWVVPSLIGPPLAGYLAQTFTWRLVFLAVAPLAVAAVGFLRPLLPIADGVAASRTPDPAAVRRKARRTLVPALIVATAVAVLQGAGTSPAGLARGAAALVLVAVFLPRLLPAGTFRLRRGIPTVVATRLLVSAVVITMESFLPLLLQRERGWDPAPAGLVLTVGSVTWALGSWIQGRLTDPEVRHRAAWWGSMLVALGTAVSSLVVLDGVPAPVAVAGWLFAGLGMGLVFPAMAVLALGITPPTSHGEVSAALQIADGTGAALGLALFGVTFTALLGTGANPYLPGFLAMVALALLGVAAAARVPKLTGVRPAAGGDSPIA